MFISQLKVVLFISQLKVVLFISQLKVLLFISQLKLVLFISQLKVVLFISQLKVVLFISQLKVVLFISQLKVLLFISQLKLVLFISQLKVVLFISQLKLVLAYKQRDWAELNGCRNETSNDRSLQQQSLENRSVSLSVTGCFVVGHNSSHLIASTYTRTFPLKELSERQDLTVRGMLFHTKAPEKVIRWLYSAVSLTLVIEQCFVRIIHYH